MATSSTSLKQSNPWENRESLDALDIRNPYQEWQQAEGVPLIGGFYIEDLKTLELGPWRRKGGQGAFINLEGTGGVNDAQVVELAPGAASEPEHHIYEEMVHVLSGRGSTSVWSGSDSKRTFEWGEGSLFAIPVNAWYQHFNASGLQPARLLSVTNAPTVLNLFHNHDFVFNNPFVFVDRFSGENDYFSGDGRAYRGRHLVTNFVPDTRSLTLPDWGARGGGGRVVLLELAQNSMGAHISQFQVGMYKKAHRHGPGAHVVILGGQGFTFLWEPGEAKPRRYDWRPGTMIVPPEDWFHQHFNTGASPVRYLALRMHGKQFIQPANRGGEDAIAISAREGGWQIEYDDEDPDIHVLFEQELARNGAVCKMGGLVPGCTAASQPAGSSR